MSVDKTVQHIIIGWANEDGMVKSIENEPPAVGVHKNNNLDES